MRLTVLLVLLAAGCVTPRPAVTDIPIGYELPDGTIITQTEGAGR